MSYLKLNTICGRLLTHDSGQFRIEDLKEIVWNDSAFDNLVLPNGEKELAWAFVENKNLSNDAYDDFIADKGNVFDLHCNRTLTKGMKVAELLSLCSDLQELEKRIPQKQVSLSRDYGK